MVSPMLGSKFQPRTTTRSQQLINVGVLYICGNLAGHAKCLRPVVRRAAAAPGGAALGGGVSQPRPERAHEARHQRRATDSSGRLHRRSTGRAGFGTGCLCPHLGHLAGARFSLAPGRSLGQPPRYWLNVQKGYDCTTAQI